MIGIFYVIWDIVVQFTYFVFHLFNQTNPKKKIEDKKTTTIPYEEKYLAKYNALRERLPLTESEKSKLEHQFIMDMTPNGNVVMKYDLKKEAFVYYSDNILPFRYLETVARKYVCMFDCKELYIERREVTPVTVSTAKPTIKATLPSSLAKTKDLFQQKRNPTKPNTPSMIEIKMNRYSNLGRFSNFNLLQKIERHVTDKKRLLKFSDFKSMSN